MQSKRSYDKCQNCSYLFEILKVRRHRRCSTSWCECLCREAQNIKDSIWRESLIDWDVAIKKHGLYKSLNMLNFGTAVL